MNATATKPRRSAAKSKKTVVIEVAIPRAELEIFKKFADAFGLTPEVVMEYAVLAQAECLRDGLLCTLAHAEKRPVDADMATVKLCFIPEAKALLSLLAKLLNRSMDWLTTLLLHEDATTCGSYMDEAEREGTPLADSEMEDWARRVSEWDFYARQGRLPRDGNLGNAWEYLELDDFRPPEFQKPATTKGGAKK